MQTPFRTFAAIWILGIALIVGALGYEIVSEIGRALDRRELAREEALLAAFPAEPGEADFALLRRRYEQEPAAWPAPKLKSGIKQRELGALAIPPRPEGEALKKATLGRRLFDDPALSASGQISCQSCHNRELGWGDGLQNSFGHNRQKGKRNSQPLFNAAMRPMLFWDGRADGLQQQAAMPLVDPVEMANHDLNDVAGRLNADASYRTAFAEVYGDGGVTLDKVTDALAAFQSALEQPTRFDRFVQGAKQALSDEQLWGLHLFRTKAGCMNCHNGPLFTDDKFHNLGLSLLARPREDVGRYGVTKSLLDVGRFRTASLRHAEETGPYMHNGIIRTLRQVVRLYEVGGGNTRPRNEKEAANPLMPYAGLTSPFLTPFAITAQEREALVSFLEAI